MTLSFILRKLNLQTEYKRRHPRQACNSELYAEISESSNIKEKVIEISKLLFNCFNLLFYIILIRGISQKRFTNIFTLKLDIIVQFYPILRNTIDNITCKYVSLMVSYSINPCYHRIIWFISIYNEIWLRERRGKYFRTNFWF